MPSVVVPLETAEIARLMALRAGERMCRRVIRAARRWPSTLYGDDSPLANAWEDICVQEQEQERSIFWEQTYEASLLGFLEGEVEELDGATRWAIWHQSDAGLDWSVDPTRRLKSLTSDELARFILNWQVLPAAEFYSNARIRRFMERPKD